MQVKKFEARTVKEALDLVKSQLGPDAIILNVRDHKKSYGLVGEGSIEITAAASEESIKRRKAVESRLPQQKREQFLKSPARLQKEIIHQFVDHHHKKQNQNNSSKRRYIDIEDESYENSPLPVRAAESALAQRSYSEIPEASQEQLSVEEMRREEKGQEEESFLLKRLLKSKTASGVPETKNIQESSTVIQSLQGEIKTLKQIIAQFQSVPQKIQQSQFPGSDYGLTYEYAHLFKKLVDHGVAEEIAGEMLAQIKERVPASKAKNPAFLEGLFSKNLLDQVMVRSLPFDSRIQVFMGPPGSGKTSSLVKLASHLIVKEKKKIAIATADTFKVGAAEQMRIFAQILNTSFSIIRSRNDWMNILKNAQGYDYLFVDYPGLTLRTQEEQNLLERLLPPQGIGKDLHLVLSATDQDQYLTDAAARYQKFDFDDVSFNFLDETYFHGNIFNFQQRFHKPYLSFGLGSKIPEDFEFATPERVLDLVMKITQTYNSKAEKNDNKSF